MIFEPLIPANLGAKPDIAAAKLGLGHCERLVDEVDFVNQALTFSRQ